MTLPFLISIPHGGTNYPAELKNRTIIDKFDLFDDSDPFTQEIYDVGSNVYMVAKFDIYRAFVDVNRSENMVPPKYPDGLIKSSTCYGKIIYKKGLEPDKTLSAQLINTYYAPFHHKLDLVSNSPNVILGLDCHSMASAAPQISPDTGKKRPLFCLSNAENESCDLETVKSLALAIKNSFGLGANEVKINDPFKGGFITRHYGDKPVPWIQIEMSRELYLTEKYFNNKTLEIDVNRLTELNLLFLQAITEFYNGMERKKHEN